MRITSDTYLLMIGTITKNRDIKEKTCTYRNRKDCITL